MEQGDVGTVDDNFWTMQWNLSFCSKEKEYQYMACKNLSSFRISNLIMDPQDSNSCMIPYDLQQGKNWCHQPRWHCSFLVVPFQSFTNQAALLLNSIEDIEGAEAPFPCRFGYEAMRPAVSRIYVCECIWNLYYSLLCILDLK